MSGRAGVCALDLYWRANGEFFGTWLARIGRPADTARQHGAAANLSSRRSRRRCQLQPSALIEYPRKGLNAIAFVTKAADRRVNEATGKTMIGVFADHAQSNIGFAIRAEDELTILDMTVEEGARLVISAGLADEESNKGD